MLATGWERADPAVSILIGILVLASAWSILREATDVLMEKTPAGIDAEQVGLALAGHPGVVGVHDLHIWTITSGFPSLSAHVLVEPGADCHAIRAELDQLLRDSFALDHTTLQVEHAQGLVKLGHRSVSGAGLSPSPGDPQGRPYESLTPCSAAPVGEGAVRELEQLRA